MMIDSGRAQPPQAPSHALTRLEPRSPEPAARPAARLVSWLPWRFENAHLVGHCSIEFAGGWVVHRVPIFKRNDGTLSAGPPSIPEVGSDGVQARDPGGKKRFTAMMSFTGDGAARWSRLVIEALRAGGITP